MIEHVRHPKRRILNPPGPCKFETYWGEGLSVHGRVSVGIDFGGLPGFSINVFDIYFL